MLFFFLKKSLQLKSDSYDTIYIYIVLFEK